ncbi:MAG: hypothetical protein JO296_12745 [Pseudonocardiales bacterium]|nr:hypothetical protein [Pseudonocardiales bacterium]
MVALIATLDDAVPGMIEVGMRVAVVNRRSGEVLRWTLTSWLDRRSRYLPNR